MSDQSPPSQQPQQEELQKPTLLQVFGSVIAAIFGVQSNKNRERDFTKGDPKQFIAVYIFIVLFIIIAMITLVRIVLHFATA